MGQGCLPVPAGCNACAAPVLVGACGLALEDVTWNAFPIEPWAVCVLPRGAVRGSDASVATGDVRGALSVWEAATQTRVHAWA